ncbi:MAG: oligoribonuclease [Cellvibrionales bacterium]|jgi:oligoribonuclease|nr:oligoribonuclease [Cellvibrionales bacterium]MCH9797239.1 oligoribonuclease [Gammaproteobacteria bacterium]MDA7736711.1 oligoribonuclease [Porticoccus sp.]MBT7437851.1 oligoribonuclease [Cellvibrionales bacterium]MCH9843115.1 oligoribonuclease [Gammaproteobacteria bacterium]
MNHTGEEKKDAHNLVWIDLEMTGLDTLNDVIIEIATIVTDKNLNIIAEGPVFAINQKKQILDSMDEWNTRQHNRSGLVDRVLQSKTSSKDAEVSTIKFLEKFIDPGTSPMCGNSICQDRRFLSREMPNLENFFHYRNLDVSSIKELASRWRPELLNRLKKKSTHLAMDDIKDSIIELKHYRDLFFNIP